MNVWCDATCQSTEPHASEHIDAGGLRHQELPHAQGLQTMRTLLYLHKLPRDMRQTLNCSKGVIDTLCAYLPTTISINSRLSI